MDPHLIMYIFLPGLIFGSAFSVGELHTNSHSHTHTRTVTTRSRPTPGTDYHVFRKELWQMLLLAGPGMIISSVLTALVAIYLLPYNWGWFPGLAFGAMMSATDPVAVVRPLVLPAPCNTVADCTPPTRTDCNRWLCFVSWVQRSASAC